MKLTLAICSESFSIDQATNRLSIFNVLEDINSVNFPVVSPTISFISSWDKEESDDAFNQTFVEILLDGMKLISLPSELDFSGNIKARNVTTIQGLMLPAPGTLQINMTFDNNIVATYHININRISSDSSVKVEQHLPQQSTKLKRRKEK